MAKARGFTLIEILAVVSILSLVVTLALGHFAVAVDAARLGDLASDLRALDARARLLARSEGLVEIRVVGAVGNSGRLAEQVVVERVADDRAGETLGRVPLPPGTTLRWSNWNRVEGQSLDLLPTVRIDRSGMSDDVAWTLRRGDSAGAEGQDPGGSLCWVVLGATGQVFEPSRSGDGQ